MDAEIIKLRLSLIPCDSIIRLWVDYCRRRVSGLCWIEGDLEETIPINELAISVADWRWAVDISMKSE